MKKKIVIVMLCGAMLTGLVGCGGTEVKNKNTNDSKPVEVEEQVESSADEYIQEDVADYPSNKSEQDSSDKGESEVSELQETPETNNTETAASSSIVFASTNYADLDNIQFAINGKVYTLGKTTLQELIDDGVPFESTSESNSIVKSDYESDVFEIKLDEYWTALVRVGNYTDSEATAKDLPICRIYLPLHDDETQDVLTFNFPLDMTEAELKENAGEPTDFSTYESDGYKSTTYEYQRESDVYYGSSGYDFEFVNGTLDNVSIDYMP